MNHLLGGCVFKTALATKPYDYGNLEQLEGPNHVPFSIITINIGTIIPSISYSPFNPATGRFLSEDPIGFQGGSNFYIYVANNPVNYTDSLGLYGTNSCEYYRRRCEEVGGLYYCQIARRICDLANKPDDPNPDKNNDFEGFSRCTRQCLQDFDAFRSSTPLKCGKEDEGASFEEIFAAHLYCWSRCGAGENPFIF